MREYLFRGKRINNGEWVSGNLFIDEKGEKCEILVGYTNYRIAWEVAPESVGECTGMTEFVMTDESYNAPLFEGDIVEVWGRREPNCGGPRSQYDGDIKVRATIRFACGQWELDYHNKYNDYLCKLRGKEEDERVIAGPWRLYELGYHGGDEKWYREHNARYKWADVVKIGTVFENADLLEG